MNRTVFYCWQSDHQETRNYIENALNGAIRIIEDRIKDSGADVPILDKDTRNTQGALDITTVIESKIRNCDIFVADVSITGKDEKRSYINQNVAYELGMAVGVHDWENIILMFNTDLGDPEQLPFDINHHRSLTFSVEKKTKIEDELADIITGYLQTIKERQMEELEVDGIDSAFLLAMLDNNQGSHSIVVASSYSGLRAQTFRTAKTITATGVLKGVNSAEAFARLDDLAKRDIVRREPIKERSTVKYSLAKRGFAIARALKDNGASIPKIEKKKPGFAVI